MRERPFTTGPRYLAFLDPSGGQHDSMTLGISHRHGERVVLDLALEWKAPFDPSEVVVEVVQALRRYRISQIVSDRYAGAWVEGEFRKHSIWLKASERDKSTIFMDALPLLTSGNAMLLDSTRLISQITQLQREVGKMGRDRVVKMRGAYDDLANAALGAMVEAASRRGLSYHDGDGGVPRRAPRVFLNPPDGKTPPSQELWTANYERLRPATDAELHTIKAETLRVGGDGYYIAKRGGVAGDGRQQYSIHAPDGVELSRAWGEEEAIQQAMIIADGGKINRNRGAA